MRIALTTVKEKIDTDKTHNMTADKLTPIAFAAYKEWTKKLAEQERRL